MMRMWTSNGLVEYIVYGICRVIEEALIGAMDKHGNVVQDRLLYNINIKGKAIIGPHRYLLHHMWLISPMMTYLLFGVSVKTSPSGEEIYFTPLAKSLYVIAFNKLRTKKMFSDAYKSHVVICLPLIYYYKMQGIYRMDDHGGADMESRNSAYRSNYTRIRVPFGDNDPECLLKVPSQADQSSAAGVVCDVTSSAANSAAPNPYYGEVFIS